MGSLNEPMPGPKPWRKNTEGGHMIIVAAYIKLVEITKDNSFTIRFPRLKENNSLVLKLLLKYSVSQATKYTYAQIKQTIFAN